MSEHKVTDGGIENVQAGLGTARDKHSYTDYKVARVFTEEQLSNIYRVSWIAGQIVDLPTDDMTRRWRIATCEAFENDAKAFSEIENRFLLREKVSKALRWSRLFGGAVIVIAIDGDNFEEPLDITKVRKNTLRQLVVFDRYNISPSALLEQDPMSPDFGLPMEYTVNLTGQRIHRTRVVRLSGQHLPYNAAKQQNFWDDSVLQRVYDAVLNVDTVFASVASMFFEANVDVITTEGLSDLLATPHGQKKVISRYATAAMMKSFNKLLLLDASETYDKKQNSFASIHDVIEKFMVFVSGAADIPVTRLFGTSATGMNATGDNDIRNYYDHLSSKQNTELRPALRYIDEIMLRSEYGSMPEDYDFEFNPLWQMSDKEKSEVEKLRADRDNVYVAMGVVSELTVARQLMQDGTYPLTKEDLDDLEDKLEEMENETALPTDPAAPAGEEDVKS